MSQIFANSAVLRLLFFYFKIYVYSCSILVQGSHFSKDSASYVLEVVHQRFKIKCYKTYHKPVTYNFISFCVQQSRGL